MSLFRRLLVLAIAGATIVGCIGPIKHELTTDYPAAVIYAVGTPPVIDGRTRFREIFCQLLDADPEYQEVAGDCENFLLQLNDEPRPSGLSPALSKSVSRYRVLIVPGFLNECFADIALPFEDAIPSLKERGYRIDEIIVSGRSSSDANATYIAKAIEALPFDEGEKLILIGHSKGAVDILHTLVNYPQLSRRVAAVVSVAGAINGSPLVFKIEDMHADLVRTFLSGRCKIGDDGALTSLQPAIRLSWLAANRLPDSVQYFSLAAFTKREHINSFLKTGYDLLHLYSPRNDGMVLSTDQIIPGSKLLGYANSDHWSVVLPLESKNTIISETVQADQIFPRKVLLQALIIYVAEALELKQE